MIYVKKCLIRFFTTKPAGEGTGLGLSISHDIVVKQHGGRLEVSSVPGSHTELVVTLPRSGHQLTGGQPADKHQV